MQLITLIRYPGSSEIERSFLFNQPMRFTARKGPKEYSPAGYRSLGNFQGIDVVYN